MSLFDRNLLRLALGGLLAALVAGGGASCSRSGTAGEEARVKTAFESCKTALLNHRTDQAMSYFSTNAHDYLKKLNAGAETSAPEAAPVSESVDTPGVNLLLRTALDKKVPSSLRPNLTLDLLMQRIADKRLLNLHEVEDISLGRISVNGDRASAEISYKGTLTALRLPFVREGQDWKVDIMAILPYAELLMRLDRAVKGESESQQVEQLVSKLPSL